MLPIWDPLVIFTSSFSQLVNYDSLRREIISTSNCQLPKYVAFPMPLVFILPLYMINATTSAFGIPVVFFKELPLTISRKNSPVIPLLRPRNVVSTTSLQLPLWEREQKKDRIVMGVAQPLQIAEAVVCPEPGRAKGNPEWSPVS